MAFRNIEVLLSANAAPLKSQLAAASADVKRFEKVVEGSATGIMTKANAMKAGIAIAAVAITMAFTVAARAAIQFETRMRNVNSISGLTDDALGALSASVLAISRTLPQTANDLAEGLYSIASSGFQGAEGLTVLRASAEAASAGLSDTETAARAITATLNAYGRGAEDAADVSDVLFQTVNLGVLSFSELANTLGDVVGTAAAAKVDIGQVGSALAAMTLTGIGASEAGTSLNRTLQSIIQPSESLSKALKALGYESGAQALEQDGLRVVMDKLRVATGGQIESLLKLFPEIRAARGALALMANEGANYSKVAAGIEDAEARQGATRRALNEQLKAVGAQWQIFKNGVQASAIELGTRLLPVLLSGINKLRELGPVLREAADRFGPMFSALGEHLGNLFEIGADLVDMVDDLVVALGAPVFMLIVGVLTLWAEAFATVSGWMTQMMPVVVGLAAAIAVSLLPSVAQLSVLFWKLVATPIVMFLSNTAGAAGGAATALTGLGLATGLATAGVAFLVAGIFAYIQANAKAKRQAEEMAAKLTQGFSFANVETASRFVEQLTGKLAEANEQLDKVDKGITGTHSGGRAGWRQMAENVTPFKNSVSEARANVKALEEEQSKLSNRMVRFQSVLKSLNGVTELTAQEMADLAQRAGIDLVAALDSGEFSTSELALALFRYKESASGSTVSTQKTSDAVSKLGDAAASSEDKLEALKTALDQLIGIHVSAAQAAIDYEASLDDLATSIFENGRTLDTNTEKGRANATSILDVVSSIKDHIGALVEEGASSDEVVAAYNRQVEGLRGVLGQMGLNKNQIDALVEKYGLIPDNIVTLIRAAGVEPTKADLIELDRMARQISNNTYQMTLRANFEAELDKLAKMSPQLARTLREAGFEEEGAQGAPPAPISVGAISSSGSVGRASSGSVNAAATAKAEKDKKAPFVPTLGNPGSKANLFAVLDYAARRNASIEMMLGTAARRAGKDVSEGLRAMGDEAIPLLQAIQKGTQAEVDKIAADFRRAGLAVEQAVPETTADRIAKLEKTARAALALQADVRVAEGKIGEDLVDLLQTMGEEGESILHDLATATDSEVARIVAALKAIAPATEIAKGALQSFREELHEEVGDKAAFQANLLKLATTGHASLAVTLANMGVGAAGDIAAAAVKASPAELAQIEQDIARGEKLNDVEPLVKVLAAIGENPGVGVLRLAALTGLSIPELMALIQANRGHIFKLPPAQTSGIRRDLALINRGEQPSEYAAGGVALPTPGGTIARIAEAGYAETVISHDPRYFTRSAALWAATGAALGVMRSGGSMGGGTSVVLQPGAFAPQIDISGVNPDQVGPIVKQQLDTAMGELVRKIKVGTGRH